MDREIKFRVWNTDDNKLEFPLVFETSKGFKPLIKCSDGNNAYKSYPIMQYTGLKDKNGKEIYEGDICKRDRHTGLYEIVFYKSAWATKNETENATWYQEFCNGADTRFLTVIGNIHENKNLLNGNN